VPTCIYCRRTDPSCGFNREHVIPEALGKFEHGLVLSDSEVCQDCNQHFGDTLDRFLNRDSAEALLRYRHGLKDPGDLKGMFTERVRARLPQDGSKWGGVYLDFVPPPEGELEPYVQLTPQIACERRDGRGWEYFSEEDLRTRTEMVKRQIERECGPIRVLWYDTTASKERLLALLDEKGIPFKGTRETNEQVPQFAGGHVTTEIQFAFDSAVARAVAKIAFNYLAKILSPELALLPDFDDLRRFIRDGVGRPPDFVRPQDGPMVQARRGGDPPRWHVIMLYWSKDRRAILCRLSPFNYLAYLVRLTPDFRGVWREILSGHYFDLDTMEAHEFRKTPIIPPAGHEF
jgi:hypothetical protein